MGPFEPAAQCSQGTGGLEKKKKTKFQCDSDRDQGLREGGITRRTNSRELCDPY